MKLDHFRYIYFLGIGGIGMSALARWFHAKGFRVAGYDKTPTPLTEALVAEGIPIHFEDRVDLIPEEVRDSRQETLVILTPAVPPDHSQLLYLQSQDFMIRKRSEVLGLVTGSSFTVAVAGTHGKTTTSSMVAHFLHHARVSCSAFLGGIAVNLNSNLLIGEGADGSDTVVVEADEFDRSFLTLFPDVAIVTSADADHLDIYGHKDALHDSFRTFISQIKPGGFLIIHQDIAHFLASAANSSVHVIRYGLSPSNTGTEAVANLTSIQGHRFLFEVSTPFSEVKDLALAVPGFHNLENALAAIVATQILKLEPEQIRAGVQAYQGVKRRFEFVWEQDGRVFIDDYAHHPSEIDAFLRSLRALYPGKKLKVIFQPHLFSRTRDFAEEFAQSLSQADEVVMLEIYPAREKPIPGITASIILDQVTAPKKSLLTKEDVLAQISQNRDIEVLATVGAGDIDTLVRPIKNILENKSVCV